MYNQRFTMTPRFLFMSAVLSTLSGCGGGDGQEAALDTVRPSGRAVFSIGAPVEGVTVRTAGYVTSTAADGSFPVQAGGDAEFSIGSLTLGKVTGISDGAIVTPASLGSGNGSLTPRSLNTLRVLYVLDGDGDIQNGVQFPVAARNAAKQLPDADLGMSLTALDKFDADQQLVARLAGDGAALPSAAAAASAFRVKLAAGIGGVYDISIGASHLVGDFSAGIASSLKGQLPDGEAVSFGSVGFDATGVLRLPCAASTCYELEVTNYDGVRFSGVWTEGGAGANGIWVATPSPQPVKAIPITRQP